MAAQARWAISGWSAATAAIGSPWKRTTSPANTGWSWCSSPQGRLDVDRPDPGRGMGAAQGAAPEHVLHPEVGGEGELALDLRRPVRAEHALADTGSPTGAGEGGGQARR